MTVIDILLAGGLQQPDIETFYNALKLLEGNFTLQENSKIVAEKPDKQIPEFEIFGYGGPVFTITGWDNVCKATGLKKVSLRNMLSQAECKNIIERMMYVNDEYGYCRVSIAYKPVRKA